MPKKSSSRGSRSTRYQPSSAEKDKFEQILAKLTPSASAYGEYRLYVDGYFDAVGSFLRTMEQHDLKGISLRRSVLFNGLEYLVAFVDDGWLSSIAPDCDAISSAMAGQGDAGGFWGQVPPLVFLPESKRRARSDAFRSVVEHEFVHINQVILGTFPEPPEGLRAEDLLSQLLSRTAAEYEACFLQEVRWPTGYHEQFDMTLELWCILRGYGQALEQVLVSTVDFEFPPAEVERFLDILPSSLSESLQRIGVSEENASWFLSRLESHLLVAIQNVMLPFQEMIGHPAFRVINRWLRGRLGIQNEAKVDPNFDW